MTFTGVYVPLITPFDAAGKVALDALESLLHRVLDEGATGVVALGTTAEPSSLTELERQTVTHLVAQACRERRAQLIVGASTSEALHALRGQPEVTAALCLVPPFLRPGEEGVLAHFEKLAAIGVPLVAYHVPYRTAQPLSAQALRRLMGLPGVTGVKYAAGGIDTETVALLADPPPGCAVLAGDDPFLSPMLALGAHGGIVASAHVETARYAELTRSWRPDLGHRLARLSLALFAEPNPTVIKAVLHARGLIPTPAVRLPLLPARPETTQAALRLLDAGDGSLG